MILVDFGSFFVIFGQKSTVFEFFDKVKRSDLFRSFFFPELWLSAHWEKRRLGGREHMEGTNKFR